MPRSCRRVQASSRDGQRSRRRRAARDIGLRPSRASSRVPSQSDVGSRIGRSEEHTSELQSLMRISYAVFCLKKKTQRIVLPESRKDALETPRAITLHTDRTTNRTKMN